MKTEKIIAFIKVAMIAGLFQINCFAIAQTPASKTGSYIISFNPVYASGLIDLGYVSFEDLYLIVSDTPLKIDSVMSALSKKNYSTKLGILDTLKQEFKVYNVMENNPKSKSGRKINKRLSDYSLYGRRFLFPLNETIKKSSSLVGFVISRYIFLETDIKYNVLNDKCADFPNECRAIITNL